MYCSRGPNFNMSLSTKFGYTKPSGIRKDKNVKYGRRIKNAK
jgi:hypothetical protein